MASSTRGPIGRDHYNSIAPVFFLFYVVRRSFSSARGEGQQEEDLIFIFPLTVIEEKNGSPAHPTYEREREITVIQQNCFFFIWSERKLCRSYTRSHNLHCTTQYIPERVTLPPNMTLGEFFLLRQGKGGTPLLNGQYIVFLAGHVAILYTTP